MDKKEKKKIKVEDIEKEKCGCTSCDCDDCDCGEECTCENCDCDESCNCKEDNKLKEEINTLKDKLARTQAEMQNFKRRKEEETSQRLKYCNEDLLLKFVNVCDNFERAIQMDDDNLTDEVSKFLEGFKMMYTNMVDILKVNEVVEIECLGKPFDANTMEAILVEHFDDRKPNEVVDVLQKGYMYKDKLLRPAMVKVND